MTFAKIFCWFDNGNRPKIAKISGNRTIRGKKPENSRLAVARRNSAVIDELTNQVNMVTKSQF